MEVEFRSVPVATLNMHGVMIQIQLPRLPECTRSRDGAAGRPPQAAVLDRLACHRGTQAQIRRMRLPGSRTPFAS